MRQIMKGVILMAARSPVNKPAAARGAVAQWPMHLAVALSVFREVLPLVRGRWEALLACRQRLPAYPPAMPAIWPILPQRVGTQPRPPPLRALRILWTWPRRKAEARQILA